MRMLLTIIQLILIIPAMVVFLAIIAATIFIFFVGSPYSVYILAVFIMVWIVGVLDEYLRKLKFGRQNTVVKCLIVFSSGTFSALKIVILSLLPLVVLQCVLVLLGSEAPEVATYVHNEMIRAARLLKYVNYDVLITVAIIILIIASFYAAIRKMGIYPWLNRMYKGSILFTAASFILNFSLFSIDFLESFQEDWIFDKVTKIELLHDDITRNVAKEPIYRHIASSDSTQLAIAQLAHGFILFLGAKEIWRHEADKIRAATSHMISDRLIEVAKISGLVEPRHINISSDPVGYLQSDRFDVDNILDYLANLSRDAEDFHKRSPTHSQTVDIVSAILTSNTDVPNDIARTAVNAVIAGVAESKVWIAGGLDANQLRALLVSAHLASADIQVAFSDAQLDSLSLNDREIAAVYSQMDYDDVRNSTGYYYIYGRDGIERPVKVSRGEIGTKIEHLTDHFGNQALRGIRQAMSPDARMRPRF